MKRFLVFGIQSYYPSGGMGDCIAKVDTIEEVKAIEFKGCDSYEVYDCETEEIIYIEDLLDSKPYVIRELRKLGCKLNFGIGQHPISVSYGNNIEASKEFIQDKGSIIDTITAEEWRNF